MSEGFVITAKNFTPAQLSDVEAGAIARFYRMRAVTSNVGNLTLATAALVIEIVEAAYPDNNTQVYLLAREDMQSFVRSYLRRYKLTVFPYRNGNILEYISYANFANIAACIG